MRFCVYQYSTEDAYYEKAFTNLFLNLLLFLSLYIEKDKVNFKFYDVTAWLTKNFISHIAQ